MTPLWERTTARGSALLVLLAIADRADASGLACASVEALARMVHLTDRQVQKIVRALEVEGELYVDRGSGRGRTSAYRVLALVPERANPTTPFEPTEGGAAESERVNPSVERANPATPVAAERVNFDAERVNSEAQRANPTTPFVGAPIEIGSSVLEVLPVREPTQVKNKNLSSKNAARRRARGSKPAAPPAELPEPSDRLRALPGFPEAWDDWRAYRAEIGQPLGPTTAKAHLRLLEADPDPVEMIAYTVGAGKGWPGLYADRPSTRARANPSSAGGPRITRLDPDARMLDNYHRTLAAIGGN